jgi:hypothetical protein
MIIGTFTKSREHYSCIGGPVNTYCEPVIMSYEHVNMSWELVTMSWASSTVYVEPLSISR